MTAKIAYQGEPGANSHIACLEAFPDHEPLSCRTFEDAFQAVRDGQAHLAMIPIDNSVAGRVADIHHLMPASNLAIIGEHFLRVHHQLLVLPGTDLKTLKSVHSHVHALGQCRKAIRDLGLTPVVAVDTAGAARELSENRHPTRAAIATKLAGEIYGLELARGPGRFPGRCNSPVKTPGGLVSQWIQPWPGQPCCPGERAMIRANLATLLKVRLRQRRFTPRPYGF